MKARANFKGKSVLILENYSILKTAITLIGYIKFCSF